MPIPTAPAALPAFRIVPAGEVLRLVLDTNTVLDVLHFHDPVAAPLGAALAAGRLLALHDTATLDELQRVLGYAKLRIGAAKASRLLADYRQSSVAIAGKGSPVALPLCRDPDDQIFLELAARGQAAWLVSRDRRVLQLARRAGLPFAILSPGEAVARLKHAV
jgi:putative PIN family toxin of toxin-antitoxin system